MTRTAIIVERRGEVEWVTMNRPDRLNALDDTLVAELSGDFIDAARALRVGLVSRVVPDDAMEAAAAPLIESMLATSPMGLRLTKECLRMSLDAPSLEAAVAMEDRNQILCATSPDFGEGIRAFLEKRRPDYTKKEPA